MALDKADIRNSYLGYLFNLRTAKARDEYAQIVKDTMYEDMLVSYKFKLFDPRPPNKRRRKSMEIFNVPEGSEYAKRLDRLVRVLDEIDVATSHLTFILNFVESYEEFKYILKWGNVPDLDDETKEKLDTFMRVNKTKISSLNRMRLLKDIV